MHVIVCTLIIYLSLSICKKLTYYRPLFNKYIRPFLSWRILICYIPVWFIFTGWTYLVIITGPGWLRTVGSTWLAWMCLPWCPEKLISIPIAIKLHKKIFPDRSTEFFDNLLKKEKEQLNKLK